MFQGKSKRSPQVAGGLPKESTQHGGLDTWRASGQNPRVTASKVTSPGMCFAQITTTSDNLTEKYFFVFFEAEELPRGRTTSRKSADGF